MSNSQSQWGTPVHTPTEKIIMSTEFSPWLIQRFNVTFFTAGSKTGFHIDNEVMGRVASVVYTPPFAGDFDITMQRPELFNENDLEKFFVILVAVREFK